MYHPHSDEMTQMAMGMQGFFVIHPRSRLRVRKPRLLHFPAGMFVEPGAPRPIRLMTALQSLHLQ